jgi:hypothetical protein
MLLLPPQHLSGPPALLLLLLLLRLQSLLARTPADCWRLWRRLWLQPVQQQCLLM